MSNNKIEFKWYGGKVLKNIQDASKRALQTAGDKVLNDSNKIIPYATGELHNSGKVSNESEKNNHKIKVAYDANHAIGVHETPKSYRNGKQHKYLEKSINDYSANLLGDLKNEIGKELR